MLVGYTLKPDEQEPIPPYNDNVILILFCYENKKCPCLYLIYSGRSAFGCSYLPQKYEYVPEHEIRVGIGAYPAMPSRENRGFYYYMDGKLWNLPINERYDRIDYIPQEYVTTGAITAAYTYRFKKWLEFGASLSYTGFYGRLDKFGAAGEKSNLHCMYVLPTVRFTYYNRKYVRLYSGLSLGLGLVVNTNEKMNARPTTTLFFAQNVVFFGVTAGRRLFAYSEVSYGYLGMFTVGVGYRFIK